LPGALKQGYDFLAGSATRNTNNPSAEEQAAAVSSLPPVVPQRFLAGGSMDSLRFRRVVLGVALTAHLLQPLGAAAQVVADPAAARRPVVDAAANGVPLVQITAPSGAGVSRNLYQQFNVDSRGLILNNSTGIVATQLGGYVAGNPQLGTPARIILNEVTGSAASMLRGYSEIAGSRAELVIANPNGITCAGCGFINASRGVLTTGTPVFGPLGTLDAFDVRRGTVAFEGAGLNARNVDQVDVLARAIAVNAEIWANALNVVAGTNRVDYASLAATRITGEGAAPAYALDVAAIGGMYAARIRLVGTEAGLGVNMRGTMQTLAGEMTLTAEGRLVNTGRLAAAGPMNVRAAAGIENRGTAYAQGTANLDSAGEIANTGVLASGGDLSVSAASLASAGTLAAGVGPDGTIGASGTLDLRADGAASLAGGQAAAGADLRVSAAAIDAAAARVSAGRDVALTASAGGVDAGSASIDAQARLSITAPGAVGTDEAVLAGADIDVSAASLANARGTLDAARSLSVRAGEVANRAGLLYGAQSLSLTVAGGLDNHRGTAASRGTAALAVSGTLGNAQGLVLGDALDLRAGSLANAGGTIEHLGAAAGRIASAGALDNDGGRIAGIGTGTLALEAGGTLTNSAGFIGANGTLGIAAASVRNGGGAIESGAALAVASRSAIDNAAGRVRAVGDAVITADGAIDNTTGLLTAGGTLSVTAPSIDNRGGRIVSGADLAGTLTGALENSAGGRIAAGGSAALRAATVENASGALAADRDLALAAHTLTGAGRAAAGNDLTLTLGGDYANVAGATLEAGGTLTLTTPGALANAGRIDGAIVRTESRSLANTAAIIGGQVEARADDIANTGAAAVIGAVTDLRLRARNTLTNTDGALAYAGRDLSIAADDAGARTASVLNEGATIEAAGNVAIAAQSLENRRRSVAIATDTIAASATAYQIRDESWSPDVVNNPAYNPLILDLTESLPFERQRVVTSVVTEDRVASASPPAQILAGGTLAIDAGSVINHASRIAAGGNADVSGAVQNQGYTLSRTTSETITHQLCTDIKGSGPGSLGSCASGWINVDTLTSAAVAVGALPATLESAAALAIAGPSVRNVVLDASGAPASPLVTTLPPGSGPGVASAVPAGAAAAAPIALPSSALYTLRTGPGYPFLVETDPRFTSYGRFISSEYMLSRLSLSPAATQKRIGDAFYETQLVREEIYRLTGRRFLAGYASDYDTFLALMDEGLAAERRLELAVGVALSDAQVAALTKDIVWMVEREVALPDGATQRVLVPVVYLARATARDLAPTGALIAAADIDLKSYGELLNSGTIAGGAGLVAEASDVENVGGTLASRGLTAVAAQRDLANRSGAIRGVDVRLDAGRDLVNETLTGTVSGRNATQTVFGAQGRIEASGALEAAAGRDAIVRGAAVQAGSVAISADRDLVVDTVAARERLGTFDGADHVGVERSRHAGSSLAADGTLALAAGRDATLVAAQVRAGGDLGVVARGNLTVGAAEDRSAYTFRGQGKGWSAQGTADARSAVGSALSAGGDVLLAAGANPALPAAAAAAAAPPVPSSSDLLILGSVVRSDAGDVTLAATHDLVVGSVAQRMVSQSQESRSSGGFLSRKSTDESRTLEASVQVGSLVSGETVTAVADRDLAVRGSQVVSSGDLALSAGRNVDIVATESTVSTTSSRTERRSGVFGSTGGGGLGFTVGTQSQSTDVREASVTNVASVVGSSAGNVAIVARDTYRQRGSEVLAAGSVSIEAADVAIEAAQDRYSREEDTRFRRSGLSVTLFAPVLSPALLARDAARRADDVEDSRLKAVYALRATRLAVGAMQDAQAVADAPEQAKASLKIGVGSTRSESSTRYAASASLPSTVSAGGDVAIRASGDPAAGRGDLAVTGSRITGQNVALSAARDLALRAAQDTSSLSSENSASNFSVGVGVAVGRGGGFAGFYAQGGQARGNEDGSTLTHVETLVSARDTLTLGSGRDTTLAGAIASGQDVAAIVGRNLLLASQQDLDTYRQRGTQVSGGVGFGVGVPSVGVSGARLRTDSDFASVVEQTAIRAGTGGFDIRVGEQTTLAGAAIDSSALPERNRLSTGTLAFSNLDNRAEYSSRTLGLSVGGALGSIPGVIPIVGSGGAEERESTTLAAVAPGTIEIRNPGAQAQDLATLSRNPGGANAAPERIFDKKTVQERQELAAVFGQEAFFIVGELGRQMTQPYQSAQLAKAQAEGYLSLKERVARGETTGAERKRLAQWERDGASTEKARDILARAEQDLVTYRADYEAWKEGGTNKVALHTLVGAVQAALGGSPAAAGALGAGSAEALRGLTESLSPELQQWASAVIGGAAGAMSGGTAGSGALAGAQAGLTGEQFNRQLHPNEISRIKQLAPAFAKQWNISDPSEAEGRLVRQALRHVDASWAQMLTSDDPAARTFLLSNSGGMIIDGDQVYRYFHTTTRREFEDASLFADTVATHGQAYRNALGLTGDPTSWSSQYNDRATNLLLIAAAPAGGPALLATRGLIAAGANAVRSCFANLVYCGNALGIQGLELMASEALPAGLGVGAAAGAAKLASVAKAEEEAAALLRIGEHARASKYLDELITQRAARDQLKSLVGREVEITQLGTIPGNSRATGDLGEQLAEQMLGRMGIQDITFLKNNSGHGVDRIIGYDPTRKEYVILEVKTSTTGSFGNLPAESPREFLETRARRGQSATGAWKESSTPSGTQAQADAIVENLASRARVIGYKIEVSIPRTGSSGVVVARIADWK
jgi:filamentous hemagglutinin